MKILISKGNIITPKSYPYWDELIGMLENNEVKKIEGILSEQEIIDLVNWCDTWVSIDSFLPHLVAFKKLKPGIVIWGKSDPDIYGYKTNINLLKDRSFLRPDQFRWWNDVSPDYNAFVSPKVVLAAIQSML